MSGGNGIKDEGAEIGNDLYSLSIFMEFDSRVDELFIKCSVRFKKFKVC